jgi:hypothetical protein
LISNTSRKPAPYTLETLNSTLKFIHTFPPQTFLLFAHGSIYKRAPTNPATPINKLPEPTTNPSAPLFEVLVEEAPVDVPLVLLATLTPPDVSVV